MHNTVIVYMHVVVQMVHMGAAIALTLCMWLASAATEKIDPGQPLADIKQHNPLHACLFACQSCSSEV